ncbi:MAG: hypothetical protein ACLTRS_13935 [Lachnospiraceae bacterium]
MLETLILCMALDYLTGMMAAGIFLETKNLHREVWKAGAAGRDFAERNLITDCAGGLPS